MKKYYLCYYTGKLEEVSKKVYEQSFNDPYVKLAVEESDTLSLEDEDDKDSEVSD